jgi:rhodanese-related sulfurtransferase
MILLMKRLLTALLLPLTLVLAACSSSGATDLSAADFSAKIAESGVVILDVRSADEFAAGHISGAINIDVEGLQFDSGIATLDKNATYAVYCHSGRRSKIAVGKMADAGFTKLFNLTSGIADWQSQGYPVVTA